jgi:hypothetical protein
VPGVVTHVVVRFVDGIPFMDNVPGAREQYLTRLDRVLPDSDWALCWYCLMGNHVHLGMLAGDDPLQAWIGRVNSGWSNWINRSGRRCGRGSRGPVMADRPTTVLVPDDRAKYLAAYIHNNPVRAGEASSADASSWSSHRAYLGLTSGLASLDIARGLRYCGTTPTHDGRRRFHEYVLGRAGDPRDPELSARTVAAERKTARKREGFAAELETPVLANQRAVYPVTFPPHAYRPRVYGSDVATFLTAFAEQTGFAARDMRERSRQGWRTNARRLALLTWRLAGRPTTELCAALGISGASATHLVQSAQPSDHGLAASILEPIRSADPSNLALASALDALRTAI